MCRLMYLPPEFPRETKILRPWMMSMDKSFGGDGCGLATMTYGSVKGVGLTAKESSKIIRRLRAPVIWHTRRISCGRKVDALCHPFQTEGEAIDRPLGWLAHNGHWSQGAFTANLLAGDWSDSRVGALCISRHGWEWFTRRVQGGVWLHLVRGGCEVCYESGDLWVETGTGAVASEPCKAFGTWRPAKRGVYGAGEKVQAAEPPRLTRSEQQDLLLGWNYRSAPTPPPPEGGYTLSSDGLRRIPFDSNRVPFPWEGK